MLFSSFCCIVATQGLFLRATGFSYLPALLEFYVPWEWRCYVPCGQFSSLTRSPAQLGARFPNCWGKCEAYLLTGCLLMGFPVTSVRDCVWSCNCSLLSSWVVMLVSPSLGLFPYSCLGFLKIMLSDLSNHFYVSLGRVYIVVLLPFGVRDVVPRTVAYLYSGICLTCSWVTLLCVLIDKGSWCST